MTAAQFRAALKRLRLSRTALAKRLGVNVRTVYRWAAGDGDNALPQPIALLLECWLKHGAPPRV